MNTRTKVLSGNKRGAGVAAVMIGALLALRVFAADHGGPRPGNTATRSFTPAPHGGYVDRSIHGSVRHAETHTVPRHVESGNHFEVRHDFRPPGNDVFFHRDFGGRFFWHDFAFHRRVPTLPLGFISLSIGGAPYFYYDGIYYQQDPNGYQEVYPPVGAAVPQPPEGSITVEAGGQTYYYAGGAFYVQQPDGSFRIAPTPIGVVVPELPPGAIEVSLNGTVAYQFNGIYYQPVFANGVTQYQTIRLQ